MSMALIVLQVPPPPGTLRRVRPNGDTLLYHPGTIPSQWFLLREFLKQCSDQEKDYFILLNNKNIMIQHNCRVCGFYNEDPPWGEDGNSPTYEICSCCGVEHGNEDYSIPSVKVYRSEWINKGAIWFNKKEKPPVWDLTEQMKNIPKEFL